MTDEDLGPSNPEEDAAVAALLAALPPLDMPDDVAERIARALAEEPPLSGPVPAWAAGGSDNVTVLPSAQERQRRSGHRLRALTGVAASVVVLVGLVVVGANTFSDNADTGGGAGAIADGGATPTQEQEPVGALLSTSGTAYSQPDLDEQVTGLVTAAHIPGASLTRLPDSDDLASPSLPAPPTDAKSLIANLLALDVCLRKLDRPGEQPIAADAGTWTGRPAVVLVLNGAQPPRVDVYVVEPGCGDPADQLDHMLYYASVAHRS